MSQVTDLLAAADSIAEHLADLPELAGVTLLVDRQKDLENEISQAVAKANGAALLIEPVSGTPTDPGGKTLQFENRYTLSLWSLPLLRQDDAYTASQRIVAVMAAVQHFKPGQNPFPTHRLEITGWQIEPDEQFLIYAITAQLIEVYKSA
ncbi:MAG: hypothetical protein EA353_03820 [Puniceicoccaceae bacterium]|nr:MAG: hypothetical protein EA353_03820 [Puniceicoccaceae bacterium]